MKNFIQIGNKKIKISKETAREFEKQFSVLPLQGAWDQRLKLRDEGNKLIAEGDKLYAEGSKLRDEGNKIHAKGSKLYAEGSKLYAEGSKLRAKGSKLHAEGSKLGDEGDKLRAEGDLIWVETILNHYGNIKLEWKTWNMEIQSSACYLENGDIYGATA